MGTIQVLLCIARYLLFPLRSERLVSRDLESSLLRPFSSNSLTTRRHLGAGCPLMIYCQNAIPNRGTVVGTFSFLLFFFLLLRATPKACGSSQARGRIKAAAAGLHHSHSNTGSELHLHPTPQLMVMLDPLTQARDGSRILVDTS